MYELSIYPDALNELYIKKNKIHLYPIRNCDKYHIQTSTDSFSNVSTRIWNVITTNIDVNISFMQFKIFKNYIFLRMKPFSNILNKLFYQMITSILLYYDINCY